MENSTVDIDKLVSRPELDPEEQGARFWYQAYLEQSQRFEETKKTLETLQKEFDDLKEKLRKLSERSSQNSSQPSSADGFKKKSKPKNFSQPPQGKKRRPKYGHSGKTRNGFETVDHHVELTLESCPECGAALEQVNDVAPKLHQIAELVSKLVEVWEYKRPLYECPDCGWRGYAPLPIGCREDFSYGGMLSSLVGWLGYGGHLSWAKQRFLLERILEIPLSQGSLAKMQALVL